MAWDVDPATGETTQTTRGNNAHRGAQPQQQRPLHGRHRDGHAVPTREYAYPWTNQWYEESCNPDTFTSPERADLDAARANLFGMHNRMHDWTYHLGFVEQTWNMQQDNFGKGGLGNDYEQGNAQAGGISGGPPTFAARDNANQITGPDGVAPITNMYLWQPIAGAFYAPCVDGDYDMSVIGHEYGHAVTNRMIAGPDGGLISLQSQGLSESWSDLLAMEYLNEHGYALGRPAGLHRRRVRHRRPDRRHPQLQHEPEPAELLRHRLRRHGPQVHADGEIWSAANFDVRQAFVNRYGAGSAAAHKACANGATPAAAVPGQPALDPAGLRLVPAARGGRGEPGRRARRVAGGRPDPLRRRQPGHHLERVRPPRARRGRVQHRRRRRSGAQLRLAVSRRRARSTSPRATPTGDPIPGAKLYVGHYQARAVPVADTDAGTPLGTAVPMVPGTYDLVLHAPGYGHARVTGATIRRREDDAASSRRCGANLASAAAGASAAGDGINLARLIDDDEATQWAALGAPVEGQAVTVDLAGGQQNVRRVQVSALLRQQIQTDPDSAAQSRFSALRQFAVYACNAAKGADCADEAAYALAYTSPADAFPAIAPRPRAPQLIVRSFDVPRIQATHLRFQVVTNQCTGAPDYAGEQDADPRATSDCTTGSPQANNVRAAEFQAFSQ